MGLGGLRALGELLDERPRLGVDLGRGHHVHTDLEVAAVGAAQPRDAAILDRDAADDTAAEIHWRDTSTRSLAQTSDAVVKLATVGAPLEMLFALIPGWSKSDAIEAADHVRSNGSQSLPEAIQANAQKAVDGFRGVELPVEGDQ